MSAGPTFWAWEQVHLKATDKLVLLALADSANDDALCWPSRMTTAQKCGLSQRAVSGAVARLEAEGLVSRVPRFRENGSRTSDIVRVNYPRATPLEEALATLSGVTPPAAPAGAPMQLLHPPPAAPAPPEPKIEPNKEEKDSSCRGSELPDEEEEPSVLKIAELNLLLAEKMRENDPQAKVSPHSKRWRTDMRLLIKDRGGDLEQVEGVMGWSQADSFWRGVILSPASLRKNFGRLKLRMEEEMGRPKRREAPSRAPSLERMDRWKNAVEYQRSS